MKYRYRQFVFYIRIIPTLGLIWAITHAEGFYRDIFKKFKGSFERIFITGVYKNVDALPAHSDIEAIIKEMKPWYDNYCFAKNALETQSKVYNCDMVFYFLRNYIDRGEAPEVMLDGNTKTDYNKMKKLLQLDKLDGDRKGVIRTIAENGEIVSNLYESFPAHEITKPEVFPSLLFYYGMLTIKGTRGAKLIMGIPNNNVRKQYYEYLLEQYEEKASSWHTST